MKTNQAIKIERHNAGKPIHVGYYLPLHAMTEDEVGAIVNEGSMSDLGDCCEWDGPEDYEWTGDEVFSLGILLRAL